MVVAKLPMHAVHTCVLWDASREAEAAQLLANDPVLATIASRLATGPRPAKASSSGQAAGVMISVSPFLLDFGELQMHRQIGEGSFGRVRASCRFYEAGWACNSCERAFATGN